MNKCTERLYNGLVKENPTFVMMLGMCPTLAVTTSAINGTWYGTFYHSGIDFLKPFDFTCCVRSFRIRCRMPAFIVVVASLVTVVQFLLEGLCT